MKKLLLLFSLSIIHCQLSVAQCNPAIPNTATVVSFTQSLGGGGMTCWVCSGDTLTMNGGGGNFYLEPGAYMDGGGGSHTIWVPPGAHLNVPGTGSQTVYYVCPESLIDPGNSPTLIQCAFIHYDYSSAPLPGCSQLSTTAVCAAVANFTASDTSFCGESGMCINFYDSSLNSPVSWQWFFPGANPNSSTLQNPVQICYDTPGSYFVTLVVNGTDTLTMNNYITVYSSPTSPVITQVADTLFSQQGYNSYQWYFGSDTIVGATDYFYVVTQNGNYNLSVTDSNGCEVGVGILNVISLTPSLSKGEGVEVFPNPAKDKITIETQYIAPVQIEIYNSIGEKVYPVTQSEIEATKEKEVVINTTHFSNGIYLVKITSVNLPAVQAGNMLTMKIVIEK